MLQGGQYLLGIDSGTSGTKACLFDRGLELVERGYCSTEREFPRSGWVEVDPEELWRSLLGAVEEVLEQSGADPGRIAAVGLANQGETVLGWDPDTGEPIGNAIVWQDRRTAPMCEDLRDPEVEEWVYEKTGLQIDPYFSATKLKWMVEHSVETGRVKDLYFGTTDAWLLWKMTGESTFVTDHSTASRTMLFDIAELQWDGELLSWLGLEGIQLPRPVDSNHHIGGSDPDQLMGISAPVSGLICDQQSALLGQGCRRPGQGKCTYGTGTFILLNSGTEIRRVPGGILSTVSWTMDGTTTYGLDGGIYYAGALVDWMKDNHLIETYDEAQQLATSAGSSEDVFFIPAMTGLGPPYWDPEARGTILGLSASSTRGHIVRAALEGIAFRVRDVLDTVTGDSGIDIPALKVDGGLTANEYLMQFQSDILDMPVVRSDVTEATSLGAAYLAATGVDFELSEQAEQQLGKEKRTFSPSMGEEKRRNLYRSWGEAVEVARRWRGSNGTKGG